LLLFGAPGLVGGSVGSDIVAVQPKRAAVLAYLMVARPGPLHPRDSLLAMFWPEHDAGRGRNALSKVIHHLRRSLPPGAILTQGDQIGIAREHLWCDVTEFERALGSGRAEDALALYRGDLLQGFHIPGAPDFDHWSDVERSRLRRMTVASAWELASDAERAGDGARATKFARQAVEWAPRDESGFRRLLTLLQSRGNRAEALEAFKTFARELRRDYGVDPSRPTLELVDAIREESLPYDLAAEVLGRAEFAPPPPNTESLEPSPAEEVTGPENPPERFSLSQRPPRDSRSRRRSVALPVAFGLVALIALSLYAGGPFTMGRDSAQAGSILVTEFDDRTDEGLGAVVSEAVRIDLAQSRSLELIDRADIVETLGLMGLESGVPISAEVGREVALRDGLEAVVEGAVVPAGSGYILTAAILGGEDGRTISSFRRSVTAPDQMIGAIDELSRGIREALGEKLGTIQASLPLERVTTPSLEALTLYTRATTEFNQFDDRSEAARLLQRAIEIDPGFAMAWRMLAVALQSDADQALRLEAARQAYHHRDRLSELERYAVEASYYSVVEENRWRAVEALLQILDMDPGNERALNNLGIQYLFMGDPEKAEEMFRRLVETSGGSSTGYRNLVDTRLSLGRIEEASQTLSDFERAYPDHQLLPGLRARIRFLAGGVDEARAESQRIVDDPLWPVARRAASQAFMARMAYWEGRLEDGRSGLLEAEQLVGRNDETAAWARVVDGGLTAALVGDVAWARTHIETRLDTGLFENAVLNRSVEESLVVLLALTSEEEAGHPLVHEFTGASELAVAHARIQAGDTVGLRAVIEERPLHLFRRVLLYERLGDTDRVIELYEEILQPGYTGWGNIPHRLRAFMRLGPLYEEAGDARKAIEAYTRFSRLWAGGDRHGQAVADQFAARARALESGS
jgi:DNA-binding SARP family transcriptional activator/TolB-like protein